MKKKNKIQQNYLDKCPQRPHNMEWSKDENQIVTLSIENKGFFNRVAQKLFKKPRISYIHLDELGSFVWLLLDGKKTIFELGEDVNKQFGDAAQPLYERLAKYFQILDSYGFIAWKE